MSSQPSWCCESSTTTSCSPADACANCWSVAWTTRAKATSCARGGIAAGLAELQAHSFFEGLDWHALADGKLPSPIAPISEMRMQQLVPARGSGLLGQSNPEDGIETEPCPEEVLEEVAHRGLPVRAGHGEDVEFLGG